MGISFGSTGIKPYVGSKEVQEAYVGSQLVYRATPPAVYKFLGTETDYIIDGTLDNASVVKIKDKYRISLEKAASSFIFKTEKTFNTLTFTAYGTNIYSSKGQWVAFGIEQSPGRYQWNGQHYFTPGTNDFTLVTIPSTWKNYDAIKIETTLSKGRSGYIDAVKFE